jgi:hypothetical protein
MAERREIWESTIPGRVTLEIADAKGRTQTLTTLGKGQRIRITTDDREIVEEGIVEAEHNPFKNGMLFRVDTGAHERSTEEISDAELAAIFDLGQDDFRSTVTALGQVNVRRLKNMVADVDASKSEIEFLDQLIEERWPLGGSMPSYDEMQPQTTPRG